MYLLAEDAIKCKKKENISVELMNISHTMEVKEINLIPNDS